jgi:hypothetical protein
MSAFALIATVERTSLQVRKVPIPDSCTVANDVRRIAVILLDVHFEPGQFYWCLGRINIWSSHRN